MVTLPTPIDGPPHLHREIAESFGVDAEAYDRARPRYPQSLAATVAASLPGRRLVDVGIGTGLSAVPFREAGCAVIGVEPDSRMAAVARARGFEVEEARFEEWDAGGRTFEGVIAGQTWHWIDPLAGAAKAADVLVTGGRLAVFWNAGDPSPEVATAFAEIYRAIDTGLPFTPFAGGESAVTGYTRFLDTAAEGMAATRRFGEPESLRVDWQTTVTRDQWLEQVPTAGGHSRIAMPKLSELLTRMGEVIDSLGGGFTMNYSSLGVMATRTG